MVAHRGGSAGMRSDVCRRPHSTIPMPTQIEGACEVVETLGSGAQQLDLKWIENIHVALAHRGQKDTRVGVADIWGMI